jgi:peptidoglycan hydrolase-like protein with peptidoglycan-binding domain
MSDGPSVSASDPSRTTRSVAQKDDAKAKPVAAEKPESIDEHIAKVRASPEMQAASRALAAGLAARAQAAVLAAPSAVASRGLSGGRTMRLGDRGDDVRALQEKLNRAGAHLKEDGVFGPATKAALEAYQSKNSLDRDGVCGPKTRASFAPPPAAPSSSSSSSSASSSAPAAGASETPDTDGASPAPSTDGAASTTPPAPTTAGENPPPGTYDVAKMTRADLAKMSPAMRATAQRAQDALADTIKQGGRVLVGTSDGNGGKPVVTVIPPGFDPNKPATVHTHYHGFYATATPPQGHSSGTTERIQEIQKQHPQEVFVLPECANARDGSYKTDWSNVSSQAKTTNDALQAAGINNVKERIVSAHSGGGSALQYAMQSKRDGSGVQADKLELQDSLYGSESAVANWARTPAGQQVKQVQYFHFENAHSDAGIRRAFGDRYQRYEAKSHNSTVFQWMDAVN